MTEPLTVLKAEWMNQVVPQVLEQLESALHGGTAVHEVERTLWDTLLRIGRQSLGAFLKAQGSGDRGATMTLPDGQEVQRLEQLHGRRYVSIFGEFTLERTVYGSREGQAIA